jgi:hypothetical protein
MFLGGSSDWRYHIGIVTGIYLGMLVKLHDLQGTKEEGKNKRKVGQFIGIYIVHEQRKWSFSTKCFVETE